MGSQSPGDDQSFRFLNSGFASGRTRFSSQAKLTRALLKNNAKKVIAIELDTRAIGILNEIKNTYKDRLEIIQADALTIKWIFDSSFIDSMTLMYQLEVGERITAQPKNKQYGRISIISQLTNKTKILFKVPRTCFSPPPKITSCIVEFTKLPIQPKKETLLKLEEVVKQAFSERRKMIRSTLKPLFNNLAEMNQTLTELNISETARAEELSPNDFLNLALKLQS